MWSSQTAGELQPRPGTAAFQATFSLLAPGLGQRRVIGDDARIGTAEQRPLTGGRQTSNQERERKPYNRESTASLLTFSGNSIVPFVRSYPLPRHTNCHARGARPRQRGAQVRMADDRHFLCETRYPVRGRIGRRFTWTRGASCHDSPASQTAKTVEISEER